MSQYAIEVIGLSKRFKRGEMSRIQNLGDIVRAMRKPFTKHDEPNGGYFWALKDVSFALPRGEILGIVGRNGAGKSTLLKILSRIIAPTEGKVIMRGRVGALLEVGTGFHDELTGRENVYLNGAILGLKRHQIDRLFDEIVDFAGVEAFIDMPIKHYSSGMRLRLGFAVAAHLNPEILIIDEVLAVGDDEFRRKSMGKMQDVAKDGRTVIFVSHAMRTVQQLCTRALYLENGVLMLDDTPQLVVDTYMKPWETLRNDTSSLVTLPRPSDVVSDMPRIVDICLLDETDEPTTTLKLGEPLRFRVLVESTRPMTDLDMIIRIETTDHIAITTIRSSHYQQWYTVMPHQSLIVRATIDALYLENGQYYITVLIRDKQLALLDYLPRIHSFTVNNMPYSLHAPPPAIVGLVTTFSQWFGQHKEKANV
jgi:lipopolysaccharide transport system ATP-binding protein